jgi:hypothetical protein
VPLFVVIGFFWQVTCFDDLQPVKNKAKIPYRIHRSSETNGLSPEGRTAHQKAVTGKTSVAKKAIVNHPKSSDKTKMSGDVHQLYADIMNVVQHNGHVTLPGVPFAGSFLTNRQMRAMGFLLGALGLFALLKVARRVI